MVREEYTRFCVEVAANYRGLDNEEWAKELAELETDEASGISFHNFELVYSKCGRDAGRDLAWLEKRGRMLAAGELNLESPWVKCTCKGRTLFGNEVERLSLKAPAEGIHHEQEWEDAEEFERCFIRAGKTDSGELNPQSPWCKFTQQGRAFFYHRDTKAFSLKAPGEGIRQDEENEDAAEFERCFINAGKRDPLWAWTKVSCGERRFYRNRQSQVISLVAPTVGGVSEEKHAASEEFEESFVEAGKRDPLWAWTKVSCGERSFYLNRQSRVSSLEAPAEGGVSEEKQAEPEEFQKGFVRAGKLDKGIIKLGGNPKSKWCQLSCQGRFYFCHISTDALSLGAPAEGTREEEEVNGRAFDSVMSMISGSSYLASCTMTPSAMITARPWLPEAGRTGPITLRLTKTWAAGRRLALAHSIRCSAAAEETPDLMAGLADDLVEHIGVLIVGQEEGVRGLLEHVGLLREGKDEVVLRHLGLPQGRAEQPLAQLGGLKKLVFGRKWPALRTELGLDPGLRQTRGGIPIYSRRPGVPRDDDPDEMELRRTRGGMSRRRRVPRDDDDDEMACEMACDDEWAYRRLCTAIDFIVS
jgi:hypothetical protein